MYIYILRGLDLPFSPALDKRSSAVGSGFTLGMCHNVQSGVLSHTKAVGGP
jgi:hypothetical protein